MKKMIKLTAACFVAISLLGLGACASTNSRESTGQYVDSAATTAKVKSRLAQSLGMNSIAAIQVSTYKGVVQLSGFVKSKQEVNQAVKVAKAIPGVSEVENSLIVKKNLS